MKSAPLHSLAAGLALAMLSLFVLGCEDQSENIPVQWDEISELMATGWAEYEAGNYLGAKGSFEAAGQRNAQYLPAYNGLGWCAVRLTNFDEAEEQFSFITTLANPESEVSLLADAYAGLSLSATIERSFMEITEGADQAELNALAQQSIDRANIVFDLVGENYNPPEHDTGFGSEGLHLLCAQNYFYLLEFEDAEAQLDFVDPGFVDSLLFQAGYGVIVEDETISLEMLEEGGAISWFLTPIHPGLHNLIQVLPPYMITLPLEYSVVYSENKAQVFSVEEFEDIPFDWVEINPARPEGSPGINTGLNGDNQNLGPFAIGFSFPFFGGAFNGLRICSNGFATFGDASASPVNQQIPQPISPNNLIAAYWDDFRLSPSPGHGQVFYFFDEASERFVAEWDSVAHADTAASGEYFTFELVLYPNGNADLAYKSIVAGTLSPFPSATAGFENALGERAVQVTYNGTGPLEPASGKRIRLYHPLIEEMEFVVSYVYIPDFAEYLYKLIERIEELIEF